LLLGLCLGGAAFLGGAGLGLAALPFLAGLFLRLRLRFGCGAALFLAGLRFGRLPPLLGLARFGCGPGLGLVAGRLFGGLTPSLPGGFAFGRQSLFLGL
ncbi:hypothetical protein, partial [Paracoccus sp. UBA889]|uniref:hypothetical protein n=1 Tax=Paracoccus sp. UBA889 TaxID=1947056 RepID=UPI0025DA1C67